MLAFLLVVGQQRLRTILHRRTGFLRASDLSHQRALRDTYGRAGFGRVAGDDEPFFCKPVLAAGIRLRRHLVFCGAHDHQSLVA